MSRKTGSAKSSHSLNDSNPSPKGDGSAPAGPPFEAREADHRISNSLQLIATLLSLEERRIGDSSARQALADARRRVITLAHLHRHLCQTELIESVELDDFLHELFDDLRQTFVDNGRITLLVNVDHVVVPPTVARDLGLIINELATNALKHAFPNHREGLVEIACGLDAEGQIILEVNDDGVGFQADESSEPGLGMQLVDLLLKQMNGRLDVVTSSARVTHKITLPPAKITLPLA